MTHNSPTAGKSYEDVGVTSVRDQPGFKSLLTHLRASFDLRPSIGRPLLPFGHFANVLDIGFPQAIAISTDGIGTKAILAQMLDKYDTVGIDCVAMNVNDVICVGAEPIAMTDYIAVDVANDRLLDEIGRGLLAGAREANITIPGGEIAQIAQIIKSERPGFGFDLVGTCVGLVVKEEILTGAAITSGDIIVGLESSGIHSNGLTLARDTLFGRAGFKPNQHVAELSQTVGEELLTPTHIYVRPVVEMLKERLAKGLVHVTSDGFLNLARFGHDVGFVIDFLPQPQPIFELIQHLGDLADEEMFRVFNMGIGFCVISRPESLQRIESIALAAGLKAWPIGYCEKDTDCRVQILPKKLVGKGDNFQPA